MEFSDRIDWCDIANPGVADLTPYQPGKPEAELAREYGVTDIVKLASNENPLGPSPRAVEAIRAAAASVNRYPEGGAHDLRHRLAQRHGVAPEQLTFGNGSNDVLDLVARAFLGPGRSAVFSQHAFAVYPIATQSVGAEAIVAAARDADDVQPHGHDPDAMLAAITGSTRVVFIANPNNPTGTWLDDDAIEAFLRAVPSEVVVVLDEAYVDYALDCPGYRDGRHLLERFDNLVITRTFSKVYALAGLRVGYALSSAGIADLLNRVRHPFNVNRLAQDAALAALDDVDHLAHSVELNAAERARLASALDERGLKSLPSAANFLCVRVGSRAAEVNEALLAQGVIVRPVAGYGLRDWLRITVGLPAENDRLLAALDSPDVANRLERVS